MKTLRMLTVSMVFGVTAMAAAAGEAPSVPTVTVTAKRHATAPAERVAPHEDLQITFVMPTDMPEAEIDSHLMPIGAPPAPSVEG